VAHLECSPYLVVAVAEDIGLDLDGIADHGLDGKAAAIDLRRYPLDHDAIRRELAQAVLRSRLQRRRRDDVLTLGHQQPRAQRLEHEIGIEAVFGLGPARRDVPQPGNAAVKRKQPDADR
jgi:hypothetical protein